MNEVSNLQATDVIKQCKLFTILYVMASTFDLITMTSKV